MEEFKPVKVITDDFVIPEGTELVYNPKLGRYAYYSEEVDISDNVYARDLSALSFSPSYVLSNMGLYFIWSDRYVNPSEDPILSEDRDEPIRAKKGTDCKQCECEECEIDPNLLKKEETDYDFWAEWSEEFKKSVVKLHEAFDEIFSDLYRVIV